MFNLFFGDLFSALTTVFVLGMLVFATISFLKRYRIEKWGRRILVFILVGTAISGLSAMRDAYMTNSALFSVSSIQSEICSLAGGLIFLIGLAAIFIRNQKFRKMSFHLISVFFIVQVITIEASRIALNLGGMV